MSRLPRHPRHPFAPGVVVRCRPVSRARRVPRNVWWVAAVMLAAVLAAALLGASA